MFLKKRKNKACAQKACAQNEARLEDYLGRLREGVALAADTELIAHLDGCAGCRGALEDARQSSALLLQGRPPLPASLTDDPFFASRVSSHIRALEAIIREGAEKRTAVAATVAATSAEASAAVRRIHVVLVLPSTRHHRALVRAHPGIVAAAFPASQAALSAALSSPDLEWPGDGILWTTDRQDRGRTRRA